MLILLIIERSDCPYFRQLEDNIRYETNIILPIEEDKNDNEIWRTIRFLAERIMNPILFLSCDAQLEGSVLQINGVKKGLEMSVYNPQWNGTEFSDDVSTIQARSLAMIQKKMVEHKLQIQHNYNVKEENIPVEDRPFYQY